MLTLTLLACTQAAPTTSPPTTTETGHTVVGSTGDTGAHVQRPLQFAGGGIKTELGSSVLIVPGSPPLVAAGEPGNFYQEDESGRAVRVIDPAVGDELATIFRAISSDWYGDPYNPSWKTNFGEQLLAPGDVTGNGEQDLVVFDDNIDTNPGAWVFEGPLLARPAYRSDLDGMAFEAMVPWRGAACGDLGGDGIAEVCTAIGIVHGPVVGPITAMDTSWSALTPVEDIRIAAADLDADGLHDLLVSDPATSTVYRLTAFPAGDQDLAALAASSWSAPEVPELLEAGGDLDGDGAPDLITAWGGMTPMVAVDTGVAGDLVAAHTTIAIDAVAASSGDFDGDGFDDLAIAVSSEVRLFLGPLPAGVLDPEDADNVLVGREYPEDGFGAALDAGDVDGDGDAELVVGAPLDGDTIGYSGRGKVYLFHDPATFSWDQLR